MHVVIIHYHLRCGGVTRVIERQIEALLLVNPSLQITLLSGTESPFQVPESVTVVVEPVLDYCNVKRLAKSEIELKVIEIKRVLNQFSEDTLFHVHNPTLGKSLPFTFALYKCAEESRSIVYHMHDFAEDRPLMMEEVVHFCEQMKIPDYTAMLYPQFSNIEFCTANLEDTKRDIFTEKHPAIVIPNPVVFNAKNELSRGDVADILKLDLLKEWVLYPVRAIERKNVGELLLLSVLFPDKEWLITLKPENESELPLYNQWESLSRELKLPVHFDVAAEVPLSELASHVFCIVTTSYREGFGMAFLEPWLVGKSVIGRRINSVVSDFESNGVKFTNLYDTLSIPTEYGTKDFITFDTENQIEIIKRAFRNNEFKTELVKGNSPVMGMFNLPNSEIIEHNQKIITDCYSVKQLGLFLCKIYQRFYD